MEKKKTVKKTPLETTVKIGDYKILQTLGTGTFSKVRLAKSEYMKNFVAIKMIKKHEVIKQKQIGHILSECNIFSSLKHQFIVK